MGKHSFGGVCSATTVVLAQLGDIAHPDYRIAGSDSLDRRSLYR
ncbi:hypothetical protein [Paenibacillus borealis]|nr:hypothetical protein [Paenibacillus borealis]